MRKRDTQHRPGYSESRETEPVRPSLHSPFAHRRKRASRRLWPIQCCENQPRSGRRDDELALRRHRRLYFDHGHLGVFETGLDARFQYLYQPDSGDFIHDKFFGGFAGPRLAVRTHLLGLKPYGEALVGAVRSEGNGQNDSRFPNPSTVSFAYQLAIGADVTVLPHIDWRVAEFSYTGIPSRDEGFGSSSNVSTETISTGVVVRF